MLGFIIFTFHPGKCITRARIKADLVSSSQLSYAPQGANASCQRANTPSKTIFYGAIVPNGQSMEATRYITACECSELLREGIATTGIEKITYGKWEVIEDINLLTVVHNSHFTGANNSLLRELQITYENYVSKIPTGLRNIVDLVAEYFTNEFSKKSPIQSEDYKYLISAVFAEIATEEYGYDGGMYPSVQVGGELGFNVAIKPELVDSKMRLTLAYETTLYKKAERVIILGDKIGSILGDGSIIFTTIEDSRSEVNTLQINSIDDLSV